MSASSDKILQLRKLLADRFGKGLPPSEEVYRTGLPALDEVGLPRAALTEVVGSGPSGTLLLYGLLHAALGLERVVLIDGKDSFAPTGLPPADLGRLLWTRCHHAWEAIKTADLTIRDGNIPLVILLLTLNSTSELRKIPATAWHRLQMLAEKSAVTVLIFSPHAQVGCARLRLSVSGAFPLAKLHRCRAELMPALSFQVERRRLSRERGCEDENLRRFACA
jgi:hypothetical protein